MSVSSNPSRPAAVARRGRTWRRTVLAVGVLATVTLLTVGCKGSNTYVKQIHHAPGSTASP